MKKVLIITGSFLILQACKDSNSKGGAVYDGNKSSDTENKVMYRDTKSLDSNYAKHPTMPDSSKMNDREDIQKRAADTTIHR